MMGHSRASSWHRIVTFTESREELGQIPEGREGSSPASSLMEEHLGSVGRTATGM